jgi:hypothetical protein
MQRIFFRLEACTWSIVIVSVLALVIHWMSQ